MKLQVTSVIAIEVMNLMELHVLTPMNVLIKFVTMEFASIPKEAINSNVILDTKLSVMVLAETSMNVWVKMFAMALALALILKEALIVNVLMVM
jgi:hypothetical protein